MCEVYAAWLRILIRTTTAEEEEKTTKESQTHEATNYTAYHSAGVT